MFIFDTSIIFPGDPTASPDRVELYKLLYAEKYDIITTRCGNISTMLEIGVRAGYSAHTFLQAFPAAMFVGMDANNGTHGGQGGRDGRYMQWARKILSPYNAVLLKRDTQAMTALLLVGYDFIHVDGDHTSEGVMHDLDICLPALTETDAATILVDDYSYLETVKRGVDLWLNANSDNVRAEFINTTRGDVLIRRKGVNG